MAKEDNLDNSLYITTSKILRELRRNKNLSLEELADKMDIQITRQALHKYEMGQSRITVSTFNSICKALGESPNDVWCKIKKLENNSNDSKDELVILLENNIDNLNDTDKNIIKTIIMERIKEQK